MSIIRKRSAAHKAYLPSNLRNNQYILAEFSLNDHIVQQFSVNANKVNEQAYYDFYQQLSSLFFKVTDEFELTNCQFIANDKLARVRYSQEMHQWQTNQQILFYYDPAKHHLKKSFVNGNKKAKKISLLFLATGSDIRLNAGNFHDKVSQVVQKFCAEINLDLGDVRIRDHQHLTYDLFAKDKGCLTTETHKLREIKKRYNSQHITTPKYSSTMNYAIVTLNISENIVQQVDIDGKSDDVYNPLYSYLTDVFTSAAKQYNLNNGALIGNGLVPVVRYSIHEIVSRVGELQMLGYNPDQSPCGIISKWSAKELMDNVQLVFVATPENTTEYGFGRFLNHIEQTIKLMASSLAIDPSKEEVMIRFHQHLAYNY